MNQVRVERDDATSARELAEYRTRLDELTQEVTTLHAALHQAGGAARLVHWLRGRRRQLAPDGSRRHRWLRSCIRGMESWHREGLRARPSADGSAQCGAAGLGSSSRPSQPAPERRFTLDFSAEDLRASRAVQGAARGPLELRTVQWFIPSFHHAYYGGIHTILRLANHLRVNRGVRPHFCLTEPASPAAIARAIADAFPALAGCPVESVPPGETDRLGQADAAVATLWATAFPVLRHNRVRRKFYLIQDYEPLFYPAGPDSALAEATYRFGLYGICNTPALREIYERDFGGQAIDFLPCVDTRLFHPAESAGPERPLTIFFYGRPGNPRNGFEIAAAAMRLLKGRLGDRVRIVAAGADWYPDDYDLSGVVENLGLLPVARTAELYRRCDAGLVLMFTRHPSYLPFEFMASGCLTVTNFNPATTWLLKDGQNCLLTDVSPSCVAATLERGLLDAGLRRRLTAAALETVSRDHADWDSQMERVARFMVDPDRAGLHP